MTLTSEKVDLDSFFSAQGALGLHVKGFEARKEQLEMAKDVYAALKNDAHALIEAQTGTGKSLAYLIPTILWAVQNNEQVIISTNTIALQEQLLQKDIPLALQTLGISIPYVRAIGASNYLCLKKLDEALDERSLFQDEDDAALVTFERFSRHSVNGTKSDLPFLPENAAWQKVAVDLHACTNTKCTHYQNCFFFKAKKQAQDARIIIVNHHLLFSDLSIRLQTNNFSSTAVLPSYKRIIFDEAHHIEEIAAHHFAIKANKLEIFKLLADTQARFSSFLLQKAHSEILDAHEICKQTTIQAMLLFETFERFLQEFSTTSEQQVRITKHHRAHIVWQNTMKSRFEGFYSSAQKLISALQKTENFLVESIKEENLSEFESLKLALSALKTKFLQQTESVRSFFHEEKSDFVYWIEKNTRTQNIQLYAASLNVAKTLKASLFACTNTVVFCSATLSSNQNFNFISSRLGIQTSEEKKVIEKIYPSPFAYDKQVLFGVPTDLPTPKDPNFQEASLYAIKECVRISRGNAFVLFTSYDALKKAYSTLQDDFTALGLNPMKQGDDHRHALISRFKKTPRSVLFATDSFWEGVDIVGEALSCVIITKLPFHVPSEPLSQARCEKLTQEGKNAFFEYSLPKATIKLKQAFGRLIRHKNDYGSCICLDVRLVKSGYGGMLRKSLPTCQEAFCSLDELKKQMVAFYQKRR